MKGSSRRDSKSGARRDVVVSPKYAVVSTVGKSSKTTTVQAPAQAVRPKGNGALISDQERRNYVEVAAYYIAQRRGFQGGCELEDWVLAEHDVERMLREGRLAS